MAVRSGNDGPVEDKAVVVPIVLSDNSFVDVVENGTVSVVVEMDEVSCSPLRISY